MYIQHTKTFSLSNYQKNWAVSLAKRIFVAFEPYDFLIQYNKTQLWLHRQFYTWNGLIAKREEFLLVENLKIFYKLSVMGIKIEFFFVILQAS